MSKNSWLPAIAAGAVTLLLSYISYYLLDYKANPMENFILYWVVYTSSFRRI